MEFNNSSSIQAGDKMVPISLKITVLCFIMMFALLGNLLLITSIVKSKMRKSSTNVLILNLALCDIVIVTFSIPSDIIEMTHGGYFVLGEIGCRLMYPGSTYGVIAVVTTLMMICIDRFVATNFPFRYHFIKRNTKYVIIFAHILSLSCIIPYALTLTLSKGKHGMQCTERWSATSSVVYTIFLFALGYAVPLPIIILLYRKTWMQIKQQNDDVIRKHEYRRRRQEPLDTEKVMAVRLDMLRKLHTVEKQRPNCHLILIELCMRCGCKRQPKKAYSTQISVIRHKQTMHMMKLFITIVTVFAICMLPNHIIWLYNVLKSTNIGDVPQTIAYWLTYTNSVMNPIIYGIHPKFRKLYSRNFKELLRMVLRVCNRGKEGTQNHSRSYTTDSVNFAWSPEVSKRSRKSDSSFLRRATLLREAGREKENLFGNKFRRNSNEFLFPGDEGFNEDFSNMKFRRDSNPMYFPQEDDVLLAKNNTDLENSFYAEMNTEINPSNGEVEAADTSSETSNIGQLNSEQITNENSLTVDSCYLEYCIMLDNKRLSRIRSMYETNI